MQAVMCWPGGAWKEDAEADRDKRARESRDDDALTRRLPVGTREEVFRAGATTRVRIWLPDGRTAEATGKGYFRTRAAAAAKL